jgi:acetyltransferase-like isoleucine patch superfamily enzyme
MTTTTDFPFDMLDPSEWPANVVVGSNTIITGDRPFKCFYSEQDPALTIGHDCTILGAQFSIGSQGHVHIGDFCYFTNPVFLCEEELIIGSHVVIGWNATITDSDFHPLSPTERIQDAVANSPLGSISDRPPFARSPVVIEDGVWIGPGATILKGVHIHEQAWIEPGAVVVKDIPAGARVIGNPATIVETD